jgi:hypothetical protein
MSDMGNPNTKILNLDDLETPESEVKIVHAGVDHHMRVLTVEAFIAQQKRAAEHQRLAEAKAAQGGTVDESDISDVVTLIRDSVTEFFPTLPVGELPTAKLFIIFGWLNEMSREINEGAAEQAGAVVESAEGNVTETLTAS